MCQPRAHVPCQGHLFAMDEGSIPAEVIPDVRVLIWDLDECFWSGTLDDAGPPPRPIARHCALVKSLAARGVVSSICSRNDPSAVRAHLQCLGLWEWFVFASASWEMPSKGAAIGATLQAMGVQACHALFVDDSAVNRAEARAGGLRAVPPHALEGVDPRAWGRPDPGCARLYNLRTQAHTLAHTLARTLTLARLRAALPV